MKGLTLAAGRALRSAAMLGSVIILSGADPALAAGAPANPAPAEMPARPADAPRLFTEPYADYLRAISLANEGSEPEALNVLAASLRKQPEHNPAAAIAFQLLGQLRVTSSLQLRGHTGAVLCAAYSPDGTKIITGSEDQTARIWDSQTGLPLLPPLQCGDDVTVVVFSNDSKFVATGSDKGVAQVWDATTGKAVGDPMVKTDAIRAMDFSPDGKLLATGSDDNYGCIWNATTGKNVFTAPRYHDSVFGAQFSPDGSRVLYATADGRADVYDVQTGKLVVGPMRHGNNVMSGYYSPDGKKIVTGSSDDTARVWDAATGAPLTPPMPCGYWLFSARFNFDATRVVTASWDHTAEVWDATTGRKITPPLRHGDAVYQAVFSPDGTMVATASRDHTARVWDSTTGDALTLPLRTDDEVTTVAFNHAGNSVLVASRDGTVRFWDMPPREAPPEWVADLCDFAWTQVRYDANRLGFQDQMMTKITALRDKLLTSKSDDAWTKFGRWYFMEGDVRPVTPWSTVSLKQYVDGYINLGDKDSLDYAISLSQNEPMWMVKLIPLRNKFSPPYAPPTPKQGGPAGHATGGTDN